jgi:plastocyanin
MRSGLLAAIAGALIFACVGAACSSSDSTPSPTPAAALSTAQHVGPHEQPAPAQPLNAQAVEPQSGVIEVTIADTLFVQNYLHMPLGESVTIRVTNNDQISHSLRLAGLDGQFDTEDDAVTNPPQITGGNAGEITFAPLSAGAYTFRCDFHPALMGGQIVVGDATPGSALTASPETSATDTETPAP